ncbi:VOC family protein [Candidatus Xianfuyuplasma coldseepsis]|uniref:VOC family protein n=1 Tax=Candidatus Xianfuyuplasma coldseepsis TaxID=2782163 RepID=A0A7L7KRA8_9MOLU|nr:VOC family protein [Xianfuyuplasma coldseepsis]QMS85361.1 VOC family protein [Xianfuyuplasma coldseepsis]
MGQIIPFVTVDNAMDAIAFYKDVFGAEIQGDITMLEDVPGMDKSTYKGKVGHCTLKIHDSTLFINDAIDEVMLTPGDRIQFVLELPDEKTLRTTFENLSLSGKVVSELQEVFWGALFGTVKDQFNITWQIYYGHK